MNRAARIELGKIASAHSLGGEVNYIPFNPESELPFEGMDVDLVMPGGRTITQKVESIREKGKFLIVRFAGCDNRTEAEKLKGALVTCARDELPDLEEDEFYYGDIIGLPVTWPDGTNIGTVSQVLSLATDVIEIRSEDGQEWLIPVVEGFVRSLDKTGIVLEPDALEME